MRQQRKHRPSAERELSLAAADEVKEWLGCVHIDVYGDGQVTVGMDFPEDAEREVVLIRALWSLGEVARREAPEEDDDA